MPMVSVIIPAYNCADIIKDAIDSVLAQTLTDYEIIVVDDGSSDDIERVVHSFDFPIKFIKQDNGGAAVARNTGMKAASGKYIAYLDSDDIWLAGKLKSQIDFLENNSDIGIVCSDGYRWTPPEEPEAGELLSYLRGRLPLRPTLDFMFKMHLINTSSVVFRRELVDVVGFMNKSLKHGQDFEYYMRLASKKPWAYLNIPLMAYRVHSKNTANSITRATARNRLWCKLNQRHAALASVPELKRYFGIRVYSFLPDICQYPMLLWWRLLYGGSIKYLLSCIFRYVPKLIGSRSKRNI